MHIDFCDGIYEKGPETNSQKHKDNKQLWFLEFIQLCRLQKSGIKKLTVTGIPEVTGSILDLAINLVEVWSRNNFYGHSLLTADSSRAPVRYWRKYGHLNWLTA